MSEAPETLTMDEAEACAPCGQVYRFVRRLLGWFFVRPWRWLFWKMVWSSTPQWLPRKEDYFGWTFPNIHWWLLYHTVFKFFKWLHYDAWRPFCTWKNGWLHHKPWIARAIHRVGSATAGFAIGGGECFHCASESGDQVLLSEDETGTVFRLEETWTVGTMDGTDYRFRGITICPACGYEAEYEDGSL